MDSNSKFLVDRIGLFGLIDDTTRNDGFIINYEVQKALEATDQWNINKNAK